MKSIDLAAIDLNLLVAFEALFEEASVTVAARRLYLGQPAMSAALGRLRALFEDELFIRIGSRMQPTSKAQAIAPEIKAALEQIRQAIASSQAFDPASARQSFAISTSDSLSYIIVPKLLEVCRQTAPGIDLRLIGFEKDEVGELLQKGVIDVALGVFQSLPHQTYHETLFEEKFVGIARKGHPAVTNGLMSLKAFVSTPHALFTLRRDAIGEVDKVLAKYNLQRRIGLTISHALVLPAIVSNSDLIASVPSRLAKHFVGREALEIFELPIKIESWTVSILWSKLADRNSANKWLRQMLKMVGEGI